ncbi:hypothetical protein [Sporosarcina sp. Marseille-Q4943]|uniref:hypothetical protein n=1 Tax=Sporosarcina sp. Marseille-Q4943 TaxID=2942204 RepID=UPI00208DBB15|nr:hypothetical protein [Sporosarcina sp. Marseille-Q4943]
MKKKYILYLILGVVFGMFISPMVTEWLGLPSPSHGVANLLTVVFGEQPNGVNALLAILVPLVFAVLLLVGAIKLAKKLEKTAK